MIKSCYRLVIFYTQNTPQFHGLPSDIICVLNYLCKAWTMLHNRNIMSIDILFFYLLIKNTLSV
jgi:hypothetical protein